MRRISGSAMVGLATAAMVMVASAQEEVKEKPHQEERPALQEVTVTGQLTKEERTFEKEGQQKTEVLYVVTTAEGTKVKLPTPKKDSGIDLDPFVGKQVNVVGLALMKAGEGEKPARIMIHRLTSVTEAAPTAPAAP